MIANLPKIKIKDALILVADDDYANREFLKNVLDNYQIHTAEDGVQALKCIDENDYDLLLLDIMMPEYNGFEILTRVKQNPKTAHIPVILLSGMNTPEDVAHGLEMGANDYLTKPFDIAVLLARVNTQLNLKILSDTNKKIIARLEESEKLNLQMMRIASHDLKNPLHNIRLAEHLLRDEKNPSRKAQLLDMLSVSTDTMQTVIENFLDMMAIRNETVALREETFPFFDVLMEVLAQYEIPAQEKSIHVNIGDISGTVSGDSKRTSQAVGNLFSNAIKYNPPGGIIKIWTEENGDSIRLYISDEGVGVPEAERYLLFKEFAKISTRPTGGESSTGLGLWIVKHLMQRQNGDAGAYFPPEGGSVFWIEARRVSMESNGASPSP